MGNMDRQKYGITDPYLKASKKSARAYQSGGRAYVFADDAADTVCHELGHCVEHESAFIQKKVRDFLEERCEGYKLVDIYGNGQEWAWEDKFMRNYTGKLYISGGSSMYEGALFRRDLIDRAFGTEVFSMWWTEVLQNPSRFIKMDPHYFEYFYDMILEMQGLI